MRIPTIANKPCPLACWSCAVSVAAAAKSRLLGIAKAEAKRIQPWPSHGLGGQDRWPRDSHRHQATARKPPQMRRTRSPQLALALHRQGRYHGLHKTPQGLFCVLRLASGLCAVMTFFWVPQTPTHRPAGAANQTRNSCASWRSRAAPGQHGAAHHGQNAAPGPGRWHRKSQTRSNRDRRSESTARSSRCPRAGSQLLGVWRALSPRRARSWRSLFTSGLHGDACNSDAAHKFKRVDLLAVGQRRALHPHQFIDGTDSG
jgi:hypothetical protein